MAGGSGNVHRIDGRSGGSERAGWGGKWNFVRPWVGDRILEPDESSKITSVSRLPPWNSLPELSNTIGPQ